MGLHFKLHHSSKVHADNLPHQEIVDNAKKLREIMETGPSSFARVLTDNTLATESVRVFEKFKGKSHLVHVGIGGSSLGPEMLIDALGSIDGRKFTFVNNIDPDRLFNQLAEVDHKDAAFYFVSKSGGTAETMAGLAIITHWLNDRGVANEELKNYYIFATDPAKSELLDLGRELGVETLVIPSDLGGRYSVMSPVGYLPLLFAGHSPEKLVKGAQSFLVEMESCLANNCPSQTHLIATLAQALTAHKNLGMTQTVFMPYSSKLRSLSAWFTQLWAESLGKRENLEGKEVFTGLTPIPAYGATDQHSQVQLFMHGPRDKYNLVIEVDQFDHDYTLENNFSSPSLAALSPFSLSQLMRAECRGTLEAFAENDRPYAHITISRVDEFNIGALVMAFEGLTALMGYKLGINPFDQPGVEAGKRYAKSFLAGN